MECTHPKPVTTHLSVHITSVHLQEKPFKCGHVHSENIPFHLNEKAFKCTQCNLSFTERCNMYRHQRTVHSEKIPFHLKDKPFKCTQCDLSFSWKYNMFRHQRNRHSEKIHFKCNQCEMTFSQKGSIDGWDSRSYGNPKYHCCQNSNTCEYRHPENPTVTHPVRPTVDIKTFGIKANINISINN